MDKQEACLSAFLIVKLLEFCYAFDLLDIFELDWRDSILGYFYDISQLKFVI